MNAGTDTLVPTLHGAAERGALFLTTEDTGVGLEQTPIKSSCARPCANSAPRLATPIGAHWMRSADTPTRFVRALTEAGYLAALIPEEYDGAGLGIGRGLHHPRRSNHCGGNAAACHAQMYMMGTVCTPWQRGAEEAVPFRLLQR